MIVMMVVVWCVMVMMVMWWRCSDDAVMTVGVGWC